LLTIKLIKSREKQLNYPGPASSPEGGPGFGFTTEGMKIIHIADIDAWTLDSSRKAA